MVKKRAPCCDSSQVKRGPWSDEESEILTSFILQNGHQNWRSLPKLAGLMRCGKSCRLRWINYLRPGLKRGNFTKQEEDTIIQLHQTHGNKWSMIASQLPGRTDNEIKNVWNTRLKKHLLSKTNSSDVTNQPSPVSNSSSSSSVSNSEKHNNQDEEFDEILMEHMSCGFDVAAPQSLEFLFQDHQIPPPLTISRPESLEITGPSDHELWTQMVEPGSDDYNEWLNYLDNQT